MANIIFNVAAFECEEPIMKEIYRNGGAYRFNWSSKWDEYVAIGVNATIKIYYAGDGTPEQLYQGTAIPLPGNAEMYAISDVFQGFDQVNFRIVFEVAETCTFTYNIPYSQVITN